MDEITGKPEYEIFEDIDAGNGVVIRVKHLKAIEIPIVINKYTKLPVYETEHSSGMDVRVNFGNLTKKELESRLGSDFIVGEISKVNSIVEITLLPLGRYLFPTGIHVSIPVGYEIQVRARSGLAIKQGIGLLNSVGTIDADYRGEIGVILVNLSNKPVTIYNDDKIAQLVLCKVDKTAWNVVDKLDDTVRGTAGFGSTNK